MRQIPRIKARLIISSFEQFKKEVNEINKYKHMFNVFKLKLDFKKDALVSSAKIPNKSSKKLKDIIIEGIDKIKDKDIKDLLKGVINEKE